MGKTILLLEEQSSVEKLLLVTGKLLLQLKVKFLRGTVLIALDLEL